MVGTVCARGRWKEKGRCWEGPSHMEGVGRQSFRAQDAWGSLLTLHGVSSLSSLLVALEEPCSSAC